MTTHPFTIASYRYSIAVVNTIKIFFRSLMFWSPRVWIFFWVVAKPDMTVTLNSYKMVLRTGTLRSKIVDLAMATSCIIDDQYLPNGYALNLHNTVIDIGGHIGSFAVRAARETRQGRVLVYEPDPENFQQLEKNIYANHLQNAFTYNIAIASTRGTKCFFRDHLNCAENGFFKKSGSAITVQTITLEDIFRKHNVAYCDLLKIDCEGAEYEILFSTQKELFSKIDKIVMECHNPRFFDIANPAYSYDKMIAFLKNLGYKTRVVHENAMHNLIFAKR